MKQDTIAKKYMSDNERFADAFNYYLHGGKQVIVPKNLRELDVNEIHSEPLGNSESASLQKNRDILKECIIKEDDRNTYILLGIENQSVVHYAMPVRNCLYDALNYAAQLEVIAKQHKRAGDLKGPEYLSGFSKKDRLLPVITLVIYFGSGKWCGPRSLHEMFETDDPELLKYVNDYKLNILLPNEMKDTEKLSTELKKVFDFIRVSDNKEKMRAMLNEKQDEFSHMETDTVMLINECTNAKIDMKEEKEVINVCKAWEDMAKEVEEKTEARVRKKEKQETVKRMLAQNIDISIISLATELPEEEITAVK